AMAEEARVRADPELRAGRFVESWQAMQRDRTARERSGDKEGAERLRGRMETLAGGLHRDAQLESALVRRAPGLGLKVVEKDRSIGRELERSLERGRDRGMSL
ncbi:Ti-type conjugative transfer relaxase TraA, partial [Sphingomonas sp. S-NIH.Pt1_0416]